MIRNRKSFAVLALVTVVGACSGDLSENVQGQVTSDALINSSGTAEATITVSQWVNNGRTTYQGTVRITNRGSSNLNGWTVGLELGGTVSSGPWNATFSGTSGTVTARNVSYNGTVAPGAYVEFGFQSTGGSAPRLTSITAGGGGTGGGTAGTGGNGGSSGSGTGNTGNTGTGNTGNTGTGNTGNTGSGTGGAPPVASGNGSTCDDFGQIAAGSYFAQNNVWNQAAGTQCISLSGNTLTVTQAQHNLATNGAPASYPSFVRGCHYGRCSDALFPRQVSNIRTMPSSFSITRPSGNWNASYDIWLDPTPRRDGSNTGLEIMIWVDYNTAQPIGRRTGSATIAGVNWEVWQSYGLDNGYSRVLSYRRSPGSGGLTNFDAMAFIKHAVDLKEAQTSWYITSVQAGFEIWSGGVGARVNSFSVGASN